MTINDQRSAAHLTVAVEGRLDTNTAPELERYLQSAMEGITTLTLDFSQLQYISSAGLRVLLSAQKRMNRQGTMVVKHVRAEILEVLEMTGFTDIMDIRV